MKAARLYLMEVAVLPQTGTPVVSYLVQMEDGRNILIDTGLPPKELIPPPFNPVMGRTVIEQLGEMNLKATDIDMLICTHFDLDHSGWHGAFATAEFVVQRAHYEYAKTSPRFAATRSQWDQPQVRLRLVEGDRELVPGVELVETSGHTCGHQSVVVRLANTGTVVLAIDAVQTQADFVEDRQRGMMDEDEIGLRASTKKLLGIKADLVIFGHDGEQWQGLKKAPAYYD